MPSKEHLKRLSNDYDLLVQELTGNPFIKIINTRGKPPESYVI